MAGDASRENAASFLSPLAAFSAALPRPLTANAEEPFGFMDGRKITSALGPLLMR